MSIFHCFILVSILLLPSTPFLARAQSRQDLGGGFSNGEAQQTTSVIHSTTRLVQMSVVVTDRKGQPITGLKKEDFTLLDEGSVQDIAFFSTQATGIAPAEGAPVLAPNVYTNRFDLKGQKPGTVTIVLFDSLNTASEDQANVREQVIRFLKSLKPEDRVAVYALTTQLLLLHEFTQDASVLVTAASQFEPKKSAAYDASHTVFFDVPALADDPSWVKFQAATNEANAKIADQAQVNRAETTMEALERLADHAAAIPGHKSLVWVSGGFPLQILIGALSPDRETRSLDVYAKRASQALNRVDMAVYPVDASGVVGNASMDPSNAHDYKCMDCKVESPGPSSGMNERQAHRDAERTLADTTGGQVFYGSNDITVAMKRAVDDGRYAYTIAFYPNHGKWDGRFRKLKVQVQASGVQARYRTGYFANAETGSREGQAKEALKSAAMSPLDATGLGLIVSGKLSGSFAERKIELHVTIDPSQLRLQNVDGHQQGGVDLYFVQRDEKGVSVAAENQRLGFNLEEKQYEFLSKAGMVLARHLTLDRNAMELRVLVRDTGSDTLGSVTIPATALLGK